MTRSALSHRPVYILALMAGALVLPPQGATAAPVVATSSAVPAASGPLVRVAYSYTVERIQAGLNELGYNAGPVDGLFGGTTASAIRAYQRNNGLMVTGRATQGLLEHIRARLREGGGNPFGQSQPAAPPAPEPATSSDTASDTQTAQSESQLLIDIQSQLRRLGHDVTLTGRLDNPTADAIRAYQRRQNLLVTGQPSAPLLEHMKARVAERGAGRGETTGPSNVARVQAALNARGYSAGPADGVMGPSTRAAIRTYQADAGLPITGQVTPDLVQRLESTPVAEDSRPKDDPDPQQGQTQAQPAAPTWQAVFNDSFQGVGDLGQTRWQRVMGTVGMQGGGLVTQTTQAPPPSAEDLGRELLGSVLNEALGVQVPTGGRPAERAVVARPAGIGEAFRLTAQVAGGSGDQGARKINLGLYSGDNVASGLRVVHDAEGGGTWRLLRNSGGSVTTLASAQGGGLAGGNRHTLRWERGAEGAMTVTVDGRTVLRTGPESGRADDFDGVSMINSGGTWTLYSVSVSDLR
jgi:peptidoglycan hydrolase-like protein with peptidoglycan-binding domain